MDDFFDFDDEDELAPRNEICPRCRFERAANGECDCDSEGDPA